MVGTLLRRPLGFVSDAWRTILAQTTPTGTFVPTITNIANLDATTAFTNQYFWIGDKVVVSGIFQADATAAAATFTRLGMSLPVASNFTGLGQLAGAGALYSQNCAANIIADTANDRADISWGSVVATNATFSFIFAYEVA